MDLVTLTDHDSIGGAEELRRYPDFFVSEEATCTMPSGTEAHVGVYDITERQHIEINRRRTDMIRLLAYLSEQRLFFTVNHVFSSVTGRRNADDYEWFSGYFPAVEARNGQMLASANQHAADFAWKRCKTQVAGSDAHALASVGTTYTEVPGARNKEEFFAGLRAGNGRLCGESGGYWKLTRDILLLCGEMMRESRWTMLLAPLVALVPAGVAVDYFVDLGFVRRWGAAINGPRPAPEASPGSAAGASEADGVASSTGFSLWGLVLASTKTHRLKPVPPNPAPARKYQQLAEMRCNHDRSKNGLGVYTSPRLSSHAEGPPLAPAAMASLLDDRFHAAGRRLGLVFRRDRFAPLRRRHALYCFCRQRISRGRDRRAV